MPSFQHEVTGVVPTQPTTGRPLRFWLSEDPPNLDPQTGVDEYSWRILSACHEGLVRLRRPGQVEKGSGLAEDWTISGDGLVYTFRLKRGLRWSDGAPLTAEQFAFSFRRALDPRVGMRAAWQMYAIKGAQALHKTPAAETELVEQRLRELGVAVTGELELQLTLERPTPYFLAQLALPPFAPLRPDRLPPRSPAAVAESAYSGPFVWAHFEPGHAVRLQPNPYYWDAANRHLPGIEILVGGDSAGLYNAGLIDFTTIATVDTGLPGTVSLVQEAATLYLVCNTRLPLFASPHLRRALALAVDRSLVEKQALPGSTAATGLVPLAIQGGQFRRAAGNLTLPFDPAAARAELAAARAELGLEHGPEVTILSGDHPANVRESEAVADCLRTHLSLAVRVEVAGYTERFTRVRAGNYELAIVSWKADYDDPLAFLAENSSDGAGGNQSKWANADFNREVAAARNTVDPSERERLLVEAERILLQQAPLIPLCFRGRYWAVRPGVEGLVHLPVGPSPEVRWAQVWPV